MKLKKKIIILAIISILFTGCFSNSDTTKKFINKVEKAKKYYLTGELEVINN